MAIINITEIFFLIIVTIVIGYIFADKLKIPRKLTEPLLQYKFDFKDLLYASLITAPGIVFHELGHKFLALSFGLDAVFKIWLTGLLIALALKLINSPLILIAPGFVEIHGSATASQFTLVAFAGPFINLILWIIPLLMIKYGKFKRKTLINLHLLKTINMWLFVFNMLPIPPLDGSKVFLGLYQMIF